MRLIDADALKEKAVHYSETEYHFEHDAVEIDDIDDAPTVELASLWHKVEELPKKPGEYIVAYHPCYWDDVKTKVTEVGIDNFRGKSAWAKKKYQRVTHWMDKPEPPKEDA